MGLQRGSAGQITADFYGKNKSPTQARQITADFYGKTKARKVRKLKGQKLLILLFIQAVEQIPDAEHILDAEGTVILAVAGAAVAGAFLPQLTAVVGANIAQSRCRGKRAGSR